MTKNEFKALAAKFGVSCHYSGKTQTMYLDGSKASKNKFLGAAMNGYPIWNFKIGSYLPGAKTNGHA